VNILREKFLGRWIETLQEWLEGDPDFEEVMAWYKGWKSFIPDSLIEQREVESVFRLAVDLIMSKL